MPNRILREGILESERIHQLGPLSELFYRRLMSVVDDFGRYTAVPAVLLSRCFPTRPKWADEKLIKNGLAECASMNLIQVYEVGGREYLAMLDFKQPSRSITSKFPAPVAGIGARGDSPVGDEADLEDTLAAAYSENFNGEPVLELQRQCRVGTGYADIVIRTESSLYVLELKRTRIGTAYVEQVLKYAKTIAKTTEQAIAVRPILIGPGVTSVLDCAKTISLGVAVVCYDDSLALSVACEQAWLNIKFCEIDVKTIPTCEITSFSQEVVKPPPNTNTNTNTNTKSSSRENDLNEVAEAMHARHPNHGCGKSVIRKHLTTILRTIAESKHPETLVLINQNHALWCETDDWKRGYAKGLENWLAPTMERWRDPPGPQTARPVPKPKSVMDGV